MSRNVQQVLLPIVVVGGVLILIVAGVMLPSKPPGSTPTGPGATPATGSPAGSPGAPAVERPRTAQDRLFDALRRGSADDARLALAEGATAGDADTDAQSATFGEPPLVVAARLGPDELVAMLLDAGADPNTTDGMGLTPLMLAAKNGGVERVVRLLNAGASAAKRDNLGRTALDFADPAGDVVPVLEEALRG